MMDKIIQYSKRYLFEWSIFVAQLKATVIAVFPFLRSIHISEEVSLDFQNSDDYLFLAFVHSVKKHIHIETVSLMTVVFTLFFGAVYGAVQFFHVPGLVVISSIVAFFYLVLMAFKLWIVYHGVSYPLIDFSKKEIEHINDDDLPLYTILIPLYREAEVADQVIKAMSAIDYPKDKLDIIITLEKYDAETLSALKKSGLPSHFKTLILPDVCPKTKPKALNVAFLEAMGEFLVIYDAETVPDADQLKKAYLAFRSHPDIACFQTRLEHYNANHNILTKLFNTEYSFHYDLFLPGLQKHNFPVPLSGHSIHFRRHVIEKIGAWDPYNVTEDCDIGIRLYRQGFKTGMMNSVTYEEATCTLKSWTIQRTRWMKGFIQTSIVHLRHPLRFKQEVGGWRNFFVFLLTVPGTVAVNILNLVLWVILVIWLVMHSSFIQTLYPQPVLYMSGVAFIVGSFIFTYLNLLGAYRRKKFYLVKYGMLTPIYWVMIAIATTRAALQIIKNPHGWEKTKHGSHLSKQSG